jgi:hypothetical protein
MYCLCDAAFIRVLFDISSAQQTMDFFIAKTITVIPDLLTDTVLADNTSTLRIGFINRYEYLWTITEDYRSKTSINGFAAVGGLWTLLNGFARALPFQSCDPLLS